jgi:succinylarginine dihydrolase
VVGPTHHYGGLAGGNRASHCHQYEVSYPKKAAIQSLERMAYLDQMGIRQLIIPPLMLDDALFSASAMWTANAATVSASCDTKEGRVHLTPANLISNTHRQLECSQMQLLLRQVFEDDRYFVVHDPVEASDEGAANHIVLGEHFSNAHIFLSVYGGRQSRSAIEKVLQCHGVSDRVVVLAEQYPIAIESGVFHNDVIAVGTAGLVLVHECAYVDQSEVFASLAVLYERQFGEPLQVIQVANQLLLDDAVMSYLFNSQLIYDKGRYYLVASQTVLECEPARKVVESWISDSQCPIVDVHYLDLGQSMNNGGGPACLRLKLLLTEEEWLAIDERFYFTQENHGFLKNYIKRYYPDSIQVSDLKDDAFIDQMTQCIEGLYAYYQLV